MSNGATAFPVAQFIEKLLADYGFTKGGQQMLRPPRQPPSKGF
jgi:hypothetical protein